MKKYFYKHKLSFIYSISILVISIIFSLLEYVEINYNILITIQTIKHVTFIFIYSYIESSKTNKKGYISGLYSSLKILLILLVFNLITLNKLSFKSFIYFIIIIFICVCSGIISKNKQKKLS